MAVFNGKLSLFWVQCSGTCSLDAAEISAVSNLQLAIRAC
jgi:hypothetical protein